MDFSGRLSRKYFSFVHFLEVGENLRYKINRFKSLYLNFKLMCPRRVDVLIFEKQFTMYVHRVVCTFQYNVLASRGVHWSRTGPA